MKAAVKITMLVEIEKYVERKVFREDYPSKREKKKKKKKTKKKKKKKKN